MRVLGLVCAAAVVLGLGGGLVRYFGWTQQPSPIVAFPDYVFVVDHPEACSAATSSDVVVIVTTAADSFDARSLIRTTWASSSSASPFHKVLFLVGTSPDPEVVRELRHEDALFSDLLVLDAADTYEALVAKSLALLYWAARNCANAGWIIKSDDDIVVSPNAFRQQFPASFVSATSSEELILGSVSPHSEVSRVGKWAVPWDVYPLQFYPPYAQGFLYVLTAAAVRPLIAELEERTVVQNRQTLWVEDAYVTGILRRGTSIRLVDLRSFFVPSVVSAADNEAFLPHMIFLHSWMHGPGVDRIKRDVWTKIANLTYGNSAYSAPQRYSQLLNQ